ncbi:MAG: ribonuclease P protein component [Candidatus Methylomirabilia bacterium]
MPGPVGTHGLPRAERLKRPGEFRALFEGGRRVERPPLVMLWRRDGGPRQAGFAVSRQVRGAARRNRARRRLREAYRMSRQALPPGVQVVCVAREAALRQPFQALLQEMRSAFEAVELSVRGVRKP